MKFEIEQKNIKITCEIEIIDYVRETIKEILLGIQDYEHWNPRINEVPKTLDEYKQSLPSGYRE